MIKLPLSIFYYVCRMNIRKGPLAPLRGRFLNTTTPLLPSGLVELWLQLDGGRYPHIARYVWDCLVGIFTIRERIAEKKDWFELAGMQFPQTVNWLNTQEDIDSYKCSMKEEDWARPVPHMGEVLYDLQKIGALTFARVRGEAVRKSKGWKYPSNFEIYVSPQSMPVSKNLILR